MTVWPWLGASEIRTERGMVVLSTSSSKWPDLVGDLGGEPGPPVVHGQQDGGDDQAWIQVALDQLDVPSSWLRPSSA